jgi:hypothetical protein
MTRPPGRLRPSTLPAITNTPTRLEIKRLDARPLAAHLALYHLRADGQEHLLYADEIHHRFGVSPTELATLAA